MPLASIFRLLIVALPFLEIAGFIVVGSAIGVLPTLLLIIATSMLGGAILRGGGLAQLGSIQNKIRTGKLPTYHALEAPMIFFAGFLLLLPGFITDICGLLLLLPPLRQLILKWLLHKSYIRRGETYQQKSAHKQDVIEGEFKRHDDND